MPGYGRGKGKREKGKRAMPPDGTQVMAPHAWLDATCRCRECKRHRLTYGVRLFNADGFCEDGFDADGYDSEGRDVDGYDRTGRDEDGYDRDGYDEDGLNEDGYDSDGYDADGYNEDGYDRNGYNADGYDSEGYDSDGYDADGYNEDGYDRNGYNRDGACCSSPEPQFEIRNGSGTLASDTRVTVALPSGTISREGLAEIRDCLRRWNLYVHSLDEIGDEWQAPAGNYTKRLSSYAYKNYSIKIPPVALTEIGNIARAHSASASAIIEVTRQLNMSAEDFCNEDSCWWSSYASSRCSLKTNGGYGLREFDDESSYARVCGRAWVMPLRLREGRLVPTFNALAPDALVAFNGYGTLSGYAAPRLLAYMTGWTYRKITFSCDPMYVNGCTGYVVAPEPIAQRQVSSGLTLRAAPHSRLFENEQLFTQERKAASVSS